MLNNFAKGFDNEDADVDEKDKGTSRAAGLLPCARGNDFAVEEFGGGAVGAEPIERDFVSDHKTTD